MILQIRATSGGGKTTAMRAILKAAKAVPVLKQKTARGEKVLAYGGEIDGIPVYVIGPYDSEGTGGCDRLKTVDEAKQLVHKFAKPSQGRQDSPRGFSMYSHDAIIVFEGLLLAHSWGQVGEFLHAKYGTRYMNAFIDTSVEQCIKNVHKRRKASGKGDPTDPERIAKIEKNVVADHYRVQLAYKRVLARGGQRMDVPYANAGEFLVQYLREWVAARALLH